MGEVMLTSLVSVPQSLPDSLSSSSARIPLDPHPPRPYPPHSLKFPEGSVFGHSPQSPLQRVIFLTTLHRSLTHRLLISAAKQSSNIGMPNYGRNPTWRRWASLTVLHQLRPLTASALSLRDGISVLGISKACRHKPSASK